MRIWSLHPKYLDVKGLVALWREALLAKHVLEGKSKGYNSHPQLKRFKKMKDSIACIEYYLLVVYEEANRRGYIFDRKKISDKITPCQIKVTKGQIEYEFNHLLKKLAKRDFSRYENLKKLTIFEQHPIFRIVDGPIEEWEIISIKEHNQLDNGE